MTLLEFTVTVDTEHPVDIDALEADLDELDDALKDAVIAAFNQRETSVHYRLKVDGFERTD